MGDRLVLVPMMLIPQQFNDIMMIAGDRRVGQPAFRLAVSATYLRLSIRHTMLMPRRNMPGDTMPLRQLRRARHA